MRDTPFPQVSISGLSGQVTDGGMFLDPVCTFTRCQPFAFGDLRVIMSEPSLNVQMIGCRARVGTHMPAGRSCWSQIIRFHLRVTEHFPFCFLHVKRSSAIFHWNCNFYNARKSMFSGSVIFTRQKKHCNFYNARRSMFSGSVIFTRQKKHCNFYTGIAIFTLPGKLSFAV